MNPLAPAAPAAHVAPCPGRLRCWRRHGAALAGIDRKLDAKWLNTEGRVRLRVHWDRVR